MLVKENRVVVASDVSSRDGIGIEVYKEGRLILEIFRDDTGKNRSITIFDKTISLELMEKYIQVFKDKVPWDFIDYDSEP